MPHDLLSQIVSVVTESIGDVESHVQAFLDAPRLPSSLRAFEESLHRVAREVCDTITARVVQTAVSDPEFQVATSRAAKSGNPGLSRSGYNEVELTFLGGNTHRLRAAYMKRRRKPGSRRKKRRGRTGSGLYPGLVALGIHERVTPAASTAICKHVTACDSMRSARDALADRGLDLGHRRTTKLIHKWGSQITASLQAWLIKHSQDPQPKSGLFSGKRVVIAFDGGRIRERVPHRRGRPRKNGHRGFDTPWREPKLAIFYIVDEKGRPDKAFRPIIHGTLGDCNVFMDEVVAYLRALGANSAKSILFVADGAPWIWDRIPYLIEKAQLNEEHIHELVDWYHVVERLWAIVRMSALDEGAQDAWIKQAVKLLKHSKRKGLDEVLHELVKGNKELSSMTHYFATHYHRLDYKWARKNKWPQGSGAIESAIRRVINLRLKGPAKFWREHSAQAIITMRAYLKAGRHDDLWQWNWNHHARWWLDYNGIHQGSPLGEDQPYAASAEEYNERLAA